MKNLIVALLFLFSLNINAQSFFKQIYDDFLKYGTVYAAGDIRNAYENSRKDFFVERPADGDLYAVPRVIEVTEYFDFDYRYGIGIRKLGRFGYERKPGNFWTGNQVRESQLALSAPTSAVDGFEYLFHFEKERLRGEEFTNYRYFLRHTGDHHIVKVESREQGAFNFSYKSAEVRARIPIGKKFSISAGAIYRTHERAYGYNPIEIWLNETEVYEGEEYPANPWYSLGYEYGYQDIGYESTIYNPDGTTSQDFDWRWVDPAGNIVAYTDLQFRNTVFRDLINRYNNEQWDLIGTFGVMSPIIGTDFYHYKNNFWLHAYGNYLPGYHKYVSGDLDFSYLNRNNWGKGGLVEDAQPEQWEDYQVGINFGWKIGKNLGIFIEGEYNKMWDTKFYNSTFGINYTFK
jgi:hypothetical protein|tara:strand:- start:2142 stop:3350 length:1209 start_codon:yes stop_codon:yes gene_type:complete